MVYFACTEAVLGNDQLSQAAKSTSIHLLEWPPRVPSAVALTDTVCALA